MIVDAPKEAIQEKMKAIHKISEQFEDAKSASNAQGLEDESTLLIAICWIGHTFYFDKDNYHF